MYLRNSRIFPWYCIAWSISLDSKHIHLGKNEILLSIDPFQTCQLSTSTAYMAWHGIPWQTVSKQSDNFPMVKYGPIFVDIVLRVNLISQISIQSLNMLYDGLVPYYDWRRYRKTSMTIWHYINLQSKLTKLINSLRSKYGGLAPKYIPRGYNNKLYLRKY